MAQDLNRTVFEGDNLDILRGIDSESIDLVYLDPPFNSNKSYSAPIGSKAAGAAFKDAWTLSDVDLIEHNRMKRDHEWLYALIHASSKTHSRGMFSYLMMIAPRLFEMHRVLKSSGAIYLHCDPTASHYIKLIMDGIFGNKNFRNEIVWKRHTAVHGSFQHDPKQWGSITDHIFFYSKSDTFSLKPYKEMSEKESILKFDQIDETGRRFYDDSAHIWNTPNMGARPNQCYEWKGFTNPHPSGWRLSKSRLEAEHQKGNIVILPNGRLQRRKYADEFRGTPLGNIWIDILPVSGKERTGYPTQKPITLLNRILKASSNEGDIVLDPFCGCATTMVSAELLKRKWIGIDLSPKAAELVIARLKQYDIPFTQSDFNLTSRIPIRTDIVREMASTAAQRISLRNSLYEDQGGRCNLCHTYFTEPRHFDLDHILPVSKGGQDWIDNFQLLCGSCNSIKGNRTQEEARALLAARKGIDLKVFD